VDETATYPSSLSLESTFTAGDTALEFVFTWVLPDLFGEFFDSACAIVLVVRKAKIKVNEARVSKYFICLPPKS
jgi:hypothetical protein